MRSYGKIWEKIVDTGNLLAAWRRVRRNHAKADEVVAYEANLERNLAELRSELLRGTYSPCRHRQFKIWDPKPRIISCAPVRDRIVHHALCAVIAPLLERGYVATSFACRKGKGSHAACARAQKLARRHAYFLKVDIRHYFDSIPHDRLLGLLEPMFREAPVKWLIRTIVATYRSESGVGLPIGNLTSQWFANSYLNALDHLLSEKLRVRHVRYMDDILVFADSKAECWQAFDCIRMWLTTARGLELKDEATIVAPISEGISFLGLRIFQQTWRLRHQRLWRTRRCLRSREKAYLAGELTWRQFEASVRSMDGCARWFGFRNVLKTSENEMILAAEERAASGSNRNNRGGSWNNNAGNCASSNRNNNSPSNANNNLGFRLFSTGICGSASNSAWPVPETGFGTNNAAPELSSKRQDGAHRQAARSLRKGQTMKKTMAIILCAFGLDPLAFAQTMIGGSEGLNLDTMPGDLVVESSAYADVAVSLRLSTVWDGADSGVLTVNGVERKTLANSSEQDFTLPVKSSVATTYVCEWRAGDVVYARTIHTTGVRKAAESAGLKLDTMTGTRKVSAEGVDLRYDASWYANGNQVRIADNGTTVQTGIVGDCAWKPVASCITRHILNLEALNGNRVVATEAAEFETDTEVLEHTGAVTKPEVVPTSSQTGLMAEITCSRCGEVLQEATEIPALGYIRNVAARQLWPHKKVEVSYVVAEDIGEVVEEDAELVVSCDTGATKTEVVTEAPTIENTSSYKWTQSGTQWTSGGKGVKNLSTSCITASVSDATKVSFRWKVSSESGYDFLRFFVDNVEVVSKISGSTDWATVNYALSAGSHTLKWSYTKDGSQDSGSDCGWVDSIQVTKTVVRSTEMTARTLIGDTSAKPGLHHVVWDLEADRIAVNQPTMTFTVSYDTASKISEGVPINTSTVVADGMSVSGAMTLGYSPIDTGLATVVVDGEVLLSSTNSGAFAWQPKTTGLHTLEHLVGTNHWTRTVNVTALAFADPPAPNPPTAADTNIKLGATARSVVAAGGTVSITTSGSGTWNATTSADWITFNGASSKAAGLSCIVRVAANTGVESRTGYVYVSGHVFTITQAGVGAELGSYSSEFGPDGGEGEVLVLADGQSSWIVNAESDWISVQETVGTGEAYVHYTVAPLASVTDRTGYITIAGRTYEVHQVGRSLAISRLDDDFDYLSHAVEIEVSAFRDTEWYVTPFGSWISVVAPVEGLSHGSGKVMLAVNENPSYLPRSGSVMIGTERYDVAQAGRPPEALAFAISPERTTASVNGANGLIAVSATPDLPWTATSQANWLTVMPTFREGTGDGNVVYTATPNSTMNERTGTIVVSAEAASEQGTRTHTVVQPAAVAAISVAEHDFAAAGDSFELAVIVGENVNWAISGAPGVSALPDWVKVDGELNRIGPGVVKIAVTDNRNVDQRTATITVAGEAFTLIQQGRTVEVEYVSRVFDAEGGEGTIEVHPNGTVNWKAVSSELWLTIWAEDGASDNPDGSVSGSSDATIGYYVDPYVGDGESLTGTITIGDKVVYITQRAYDASISPSAATVGGNAGAGEFGFSASIDDVWTALDILCSKDWIETAQVTSFNAATKSGTIRYTYAANDSGVPRTGTIVVAGEAYQLTQSARQVARIEAEVEGVGGTVTGGGAYDVGATVTLRATPAEGYRFTGWSGASSSTSATLAFTASVNRTYVAHFERIPVYTVNGETVREGTVVTCTAPADRIDNAGTLKLVCLGTSAYPEKGANFTLVANEDVTFGWDLWATNYLVTVDGVSGWNRAGTVKTLTPKIPSGMTFFRWTGDVACAEAGDNPLHLVVDGPKTVTSESGNFVNLLSEALDAPPMTFRTGGDGVWSAAVDAQAKTGFTAAHVTTGPSSDAWLETSVSGDGQISFDWRTVCEHDDSGAREWDRLVVFVNGVEKARIDGQTDYQTVTLPISGERTVIRWSFYRDEHDEADAPPVPQAWIDGIALTGSVVPADNNDSPLGGVQLWEGGPYWAECNVGAAKPEEYGYYFWWGDTVGYKRNALDDGWVSVKDGTSFLFEDVNCPTCGKSNLQLQSAGYIDATGNLVAAHDAATAHLGAPWRMPTIEEFNTLIRKCTTIWTTRNGVRGMLVIGEGAYASKSIFLPVAGYGEGGGCVFYGTPGRYWSSTPDSDDYPNDALSLCIDIAVYYVGGAIIHCSSMSGRYLGQSLRPVRGFAQ